MSLHRLCEAIFQQICLKPLFKYFLFLFIFNIMFSFLLNNLNHTNFVQRVLLSLFEAIAYVK